MVEKDSRDLRFLKAIGFGKEESTWITQYDGFPIRGGFLSDYAMVGRESPTNAYCGKHRGYMKCTETSLHDAIGGQDFYHNSVTNCHSYRCHTCWKYGWCVYRANIVESRFLTAEKLLGLDHKLVEHVCASVPKKLYNLSPQEMVKEAILACKRSGVPSGVTILHPFEKTRNVGICSRVSIFTCLATLTVGMTVVENVLRLGLVGIVMVLKGLLVERIEVTAGLLL